MIATSKVRSTDVAGFLRMLHPDGVFEVRSPKCPERKGGSYTSTHIGYFDDIAKAASEVVRLEKLEPPGIYVSANPVEPSLLARANNRIIAKAGSTTNDGEVIRRRWLPIDLDPVRPAGTSSTDVEMQYALELADIIRAELSAENWSDPVKCMSGNGAYLLYPIDLPNDEPSRDLVQRTLQGLSKRFSTHRVTLDTNVFNASRIIKLMGTWARKGDDLRGSTLTADRPHRQSWFATEATEGGES